MFFEGEAAGIAWVWLCLPETKSATLEDMDRVFNSHTGEADQRLLSACRRELGLEPALEAAAIDEVRKMSVGAEKDAAARMEAV